MTKRIIKEPVNTKSHKPLSSMSDEEWKDIIKQANKNIIQKESKYE